MAILDLVHNIVMSFAADLAKLTDEMKAENELAACSNYYFVDALRPVSQELTELTGRTYKSYLAEAQELLMQGAEMADVLNYFDAKLYELKEGRKNGRNTSFDTQKILGSD